MLHGLITRGAFFYSRLRRGTLRENARAREGNASECRTVPLNRGRWERERCEAHQQRVPSEVRQLRYSADKLACTAFSSVMVERHCRDQLRRRGLN